MSSDDDIGSELVLGGYSSDHYEGDIFWTDITQDSYYMVNCTSIESSNDDYVVEMSSNCIIDSGTSWIMGPRDDIKSMYENIFADYCTWEAVGGTMTVNDCDNLDELPDIQIWIDGKEFTLTYDDYTTSGINYCYLQFGSMIGDLWILGM